MLGHYERTGASASSVGALSYWCSAETKNLWQYHYLRYFEGRFYPAVMIYWILSDGKDFDFVSTPPNTMNLNSCSMMRKETSAFVKFTTVCVCVCYSTKPLLQQRVNQSLLFKLNDHTYSHWYWDCSKLWVTIYVLLLSAGSGGNLHHWISTTKFTAEGNKLNKNN